MVVIDGYSLVFYPKENRIIINLPQTTTTLTNTIEMTSDRKTEMTANEEAIILSIVRAILEGMEVDNEQTD